jgi:ferredoxin
VTLVVCTDHGTPLPSADEATYDVVGVEGLCADPSTLIERGVSPEALVLHTGEFDLGFVQGAVRKHGVDPLGVPIVTLPYLPRDIDLQILGAGAIARHRAFSGAGPENAKLRWPELISRRRMFALNVPQYIAAPSIDHTLCSTKTGCKLCVDSCPTGALARVDGSIAHSIDVCAACGICTTTCPTAAISNPSADPKQIASQIAAMVSAAPGRIGIRYHCRDAIPPAFADGWYPLEVPCTGMLTVGWLLAPLLLGAASVSADPCEISGCSLGNDDRLTEHVDTAIAVCDELGLGADRIRSSNGDDLPQPFDPLPAEAVGDMSDADVFLGMVTIASTDDFVMAASAGSVGVVTIDESWCTVCEQCTTVCPTGALDAHHSEMAIDITFDATLCVGCSICLTTCPELEKGAITLDRRFDSAELRRGRHTVRVGSTTTCEVCGGAIAPSAMLNRIRSMLGSEHAGTVDLIGTRCIDCR